MIVVPPYVTEAVESVLAAEWSMWAAEEEGGSLCSVDATHYRDLLLHAETLARFVKDLKEGKQG